MRVDLNVPYENGVVSDATRIERAAPSITELADKGAKVILLSHFGRPKGPNPKDSLKTVAAEVAHTINARSNSFPTASATKAERAVAAMHSGEIICLENTRFHPARKKTIRPLSRNSPSSAISSSNDAFSVSHRAHASTEGFPIYCPLSPAVHCRPNSRPSRKCSTSPSARWSPSSAAPRFPPSSIS